MTIRLRFLPEVEEDVMAGYFWYEEKAAGLGEEFMRVFYTAVGEIHTLPHRFTPVNREMRRCLLRRFPYAIYFKCEVEEITVVGLFHCARDPIVIRDSLVERTRLDKDS